MINQFGGAFTGNLNVLGLIVAIALLVLIVYMLVKPCKGGRQALPQSSDFAKYCP